MNGLYNVARLAGLGDALSDLQAQLNSSNDLVAQKKALVDSITNSRGELLPGHSGRTLNQLVTDYNSALQASRDISSKIDALVAANAAAKSTADADAAAKAADAAAKAAAFALSPDGKLQAARDYVEQQDLYTRISLQPKTDYGRGYSRRNAYYGLGDFPMTSRLLSLHDQKGLGFDLWGAIAKGAEQGAAKYAASTDKGSLPAGPRIPGLPSVAVPGWLSQTADYLKKPVASIGSGIFSSVKAAKNAPTASAAATGVRQSVAVSGGFSLGYAALALLVLGGGFYMVKKS